jgi:hypothetical protein
MVNINTKILKVLDEKAKRLTMVNAINITAPKYKYSTLITFMALNEDIASLLILTDLSLKNEVK